MWHANRVSALRRELNSHKGANPHRGWALRSRASGRGSKSSQSGMSNNFAQTDATAGALGRSQSMTWHRCTSSSHRTAWETSVSSQFMGPPATTSGLAPGRRRRLEAVARLRQQRGAGRNCGALPRTTRLQSHCATRTAPPNPSFEARPNGKPPGPPGAVVYPTPVGPGALPSVTPQLER